MVSIERWKEQYCHLAEGPQNDIYIVPQIRGGRVKKKVYQVKMTGKMVSSMAVNVDRAQAKLNKSKNKNLLKKKNKNKSEEKKKTQLGEIVIPKCMKKKSSDKEKKSQRKT